MHTTGWLSKGTGRPSGSRQSVLFLVTRSGFPAAVFCFIYQLFEPHVMVRAVCNGSRSAPSKFAYCRTAPGPRSVDLRSENAPRPSGRAVPAPPWDALSDGEDRSWKPSRSLEKKNTLCIRLPRSYRVALSTVPGGRRFRQGPRRDQQRNFAGATRLLQVLQICRHTLQRCLNRSGGDDR